MVNAPVTEQPERALTLSYAPVARQAALEALFALDARLRQVALAARDPTIGLMRLTWWGDALARLDTAPAPAEPLLRQLAAEVVPAGVRGETLGGLVDGWAELLEEAPDMATHARARGGRLFVLAAQLLGADDPRVEQVGEGWAMDDVAAGWPALAEEARAFGLGRLAGAFDRPWPRALRSLGALGLSARFNLAQIGRPGSPRRVARLLAHRLTGR